MTKGKIKQMLNKEFIIEVDYQTNNGYNLEQFEIHPCFANVKWVLEQEVKFVYCTECTTHYPIACDCFKRKLFAFPILPQKKGFKAKFLKLVNKFRIKKNG